MYTYEDVINDLENIQDMLMKAKTKEDLKKVMKDLSFVIALLYDVVDKDARN
ncbi:MAG: hypothetical protein QXO37_06830 [Candidatus Nitrosocaldaceae archaeon]